MTIDERTEAVMKAVVGDSFGSKFKGGPAHDCRIWKPQLTVGDTYGIIRDAMARAAYENADALMANASTLITAAEELLAVVSECYVVTGDVRVDRSATQRRKLAAILAKAKGAE